MVQLKDSIEKYGVLTPLLVRPVPEGSYEIISGHRRKFAAEQLGYRRLPVIIRVMKDEEAVIKMVDSNFQREEISPSEKAFAYKMKYEAIKGKGRKNIGGQVDHQYKGKKTIEIIGKEIGDSPKQAQRIKKLSQEEKLTVEKMQDILGEVKKGEIDRVVFKNEQLHKYFPPNYSSSKMKREILELRLMTVSSFSASTVSRCMPTLQWSVLPA